MKITIEEYDEEYRAIVIDLWYKSVLATHEFLDKSDVEFYKSLVDEIDFNSFDVFCAFSESRKMVGILGTQGDKLEMLFIKPDCIGQGIGKRLMEFALEELKICYVDVNEANKNAVRFYRSFGFRVYDRLALDEQGKPHPLLKMHLK
jgi:putative acetyltransferase